MSSSCPGISLLRFDLSAVEGSTEEAKTSMGVTSFTQFGAALGQVLPSSFLPHDWDTHGSICEELSSTLLHQAESEADYQAMISSLLEMGPSALDLEVQDAYTVYCTPVHLYTCR